MCASAQSCHPPRFLGRMPIRGQRPPRVWTIAQCACRSMSTPKDQPTAAPSSAAPAPPGQLTSRAIHRPGRPSFRHRFRARGRSASAPSLRLRHARPAKALVSDPPPAARRGRGARGQAAAQSRFKLQVVPGRALIFPGSGAGRPGPAYEAQAGGRGRRKVKEASPGPALTCVLTKSFLCQWPGPGPGAQTTRMRAGLGSRRKDRHDAPTTTGTDTENRHVRPRRRLAGSYLPLTILRATP